MRGMMAFCLAIVFFFIFPKPVRAESIIADSGAFAEIDNMDDSEIVAGTISTLGDVIDDSALDDDITDLTDSLLSQLDTDAIDDVFAESEDTEGISFSEIVRGILDTEGEVSKTDIIEKTFSLAFSEIEECRTLLIRLMILALAFAFFNSFINASPDSQISKTGFYMFFLVMMALLLQSYLMIAGLFSEVMERVVKMMEAVIPAFAMTLVFASAQTTAAAFYQIAVAVIWLVERLLLNIAAPVVHVYAVLQILNCLTGERMISRLTDLIKKIIRWTLRALLAGVTGINVIETMIAPSVDNLKKASVTRALGMIPGLGDVTEAVGNIFIGSALVIKNGVGAAAMIALLCVIFTPVVKMLVFLLMYKAAGAIVQPFAGTRACGCIDSIGESAALLLETLLVGTLVFLISLALVITAVR